MSVATKGRGPRASLNGRLCERSTMTTCESSWNRQLARVLILRIAESLSAGFELEIGLNEIFFWDGIVYLRKSSVTIFRKSFSVFSAHCMTKKQVFLALSVYDILFDSECT